MLHGHFPQLQPIDAGGPGHTSGHLQGGIGFRLQGKAQGPEVFPFGGGVELEAGAGGGHIAGDAFAPVVAGGGEAFGVFISEMDHAGVGAKGLLPGTEQGVEAFGVGGEAGAQLGIHQVFQQGGHPQASAAGPAAGHGVGGPHRFGPQPGGAVAALSGGLPPGQRTSGHQGQSGGQILQAAPVVFAVEQGNPAGPVGVALSSAQLHLGNPAAPGDQAEGPALHVTPPAQFIGQVGMAAGEGQFRQPGGGGSRLDGQALHLPGPPLGLFGDRLARLQRQARPAFVVWGGLAALSFWFHRAAGQGETGGGIDDAVGQEVAFAQPGPQVFRAEGEGMGRWRDAGACWFGDAPGVSPHQQRRTPGTGGGTNGGKPGGVQQAHGRDADSMRWVP